MQAVGLVGVEYKGKGGVRGGEAMRSPDKEARVEEGDRFGCYFVPPGRRWWHTEVERLRGTILICRLDQINLPSKMDSI